MSALSELSGNKDTEVPSYFFGGIPAMSGLAGALTKHIKPPKPFAGGMMGGGLAGLMSKIVSAQNRAINSNPFPMKGGLGEVAKIVSAQNRAFEDINSNLAMPSKETYKPTYTEAPSNFATEQSSRLKELFSPTSSVRDPSTGEIFVNSDRSSINRIDRSGYGNSPFTRDSLLRTQSAPKYSVQTRQVPYKYQVIEDYQEPDYYNYIRNNKDARKAFEGSTAARNIAKKAWNNKTGKIDYNKFDKDGYADAARDYARNYYDTTGKGAGHELPMRDMQRYADRERMLEEEFIDTNPDRFDRTQNTQQAIIDRLSGYSNNFAPRQQQFNPYSRFSDYLNRGSSGMPSYGGFSRGRSGGLRGLFNSLLGGGGNRYGGSPMRSMLGGGLRSLLGQGLGRRQPDVQLDYMKSPFGGYR